MSVSLLEAPPEAQPMLERLFQLYAYDFSELMGLDVDNEGRFHGGTPIDTCWTQPWRHAFVIKVGEQIAGFCILDERSRLSGDSSVCDVAEFFVLRKYRRRGVGAAAARLAFDRYPRRWEVRQSAANTAATVFWRRTIAQYTGGAFTETTLADERWRGPVQMFGPL